MDDLKKLLAKRAPVKVNKNLHSPVHALADEITTAFGERKRFAMYLGTINRIGVERARGIYRQLQQEGNAKNKGKLFMFLCKKEKTVPKTVPEAAAATPDTPA